jgi:hypothetical protein
MDFNELEDKMKRNEKKPVIKIDETTQEKPDNTISWQSISLIIGVAILLIILAVAFVKYVPFLGPETVEYNFFKFAKIDDLWQTQWQSNTGRSYTVPFRFNPLETLEVPVLGALNDSFNDADVLYITFNPLSDEKDFKYLAMGATDLSFAFLGPLNRKVEMACTVNQTEACSVRPIVNCGDENKSVIFLEINSPERVSLSDRCVHIQGRELNLLKSVDRILYQYYRIIQ